MDEHKRMLSDELESFEAKPLRTDQGRWVVFYSSVVGTSKNKMISDYTPYS